VKGSTSRVGCDKDIEYASRAKCNLRLHSDIFHAACLSLMKQRCMIGYRPAASCPDNHVLVVDTLNRAVHGYRKLLGRANPIAPF
jgi:hypothetical protein